MTALLLVVLVVSGISMLVSVAFVAHELGWFPHTKDRSKPIDRRFFFASRYDTDRLATHDFQVMHEFNYELRKIAHPDVYNFQDPYQALENVISSYNKQPTRSHYDDLVHLANYISNKVKSDERINALIDRISELTLSKPYKE